MNSRRLNHTTRAAVALVPLIAIGLLCACSRGPSTHFELSQAELTSTVPSVQAETALKQFFNALGEGDGARVSLLLVEDRRDIDWSVRRLQVETITPEPEYQGEGRGTRYLTFRAPVRMWPGDASVVAGERLDWIWVLELGPDGKWRVKDWGFI